MVDQTTLRGSEDQLVESSSEDEDGARVDHNDEEDSFHSFVAEHSVHSDAEEQPEPSSRKYIIQKLYKQFVL